MITITNNEANDSIGIGGTFFNDLLAERKELLKRLKQNDEQELSQRLNKVEGILERMELEKYKIDCEIRKYQIDKKYSLKSF